MAWTAAWTAIGELSPIGAFASPAATQAQSPLAQLAAVLGGDGIVFILAWPGAALWCVLQPNALHCFLTCLKTRRWYAAWSRLEFCCRLLLSGAIASPPR